MKVKCGVGLGVRSSLPESSVFGEFVDLLEELRFDSLWLSDRATGASLDPLSALAFAAGRTRRLKLGTSALVVPGRGIFRGSSALINLQETDAVTMVIVPSVAQHIAFDDV